MYLVPIFLLAGPLVFVHTISTFNFLSPFISGISYLASVPQGEVDAAIPGTLAPAGVGSVFPQTPAPASIDFSIPTYRFNPNSPNSFSTAGETGSTPDYGSSIEAFRPPAGDSQPQNYKCSLPTDIIMCCESHSSEEWVGCDFCMCSRFFLKKRNPRSAFDFKNPSIKD